MTTKPGMNRRDVLKGGVTLTIAGATATVFLPRKSRAQGTVSLAFVPKALNNPVFEITRAGAEDRVAELDGVSFRWVGPTTTDAAAQSQIIDDLVVQGVDGICLSANDPAALMPAINRATSEGVAVITWDANSPDSQRLTNVAIDQEEAGFMAGQQMLSRIQSGKVAILTGTPGALNLEQRRDGFLRGIEGSDLEVIATDPNFDDVQRAVEIVEQRINATPNLAGYFFVGMWPFFADLETMPQLKEFVSGGGICVSLDALSGAIAAVEEGYCNILIGYSWYGFGTTAVDVLVDYVRNGVEPNDPLYTDLFIVDESNIAEYAALDRETEGRW
ncbi:substrate-binding domain-containing protein [Ahrensia marina]|uniref:substrate-binding domain-containing protein n=1 Tax=Ahrensia marina TaxID=1514904 RepID=UPI0035CFBDD9